MPSNPTNPSTIFSGLQQVTINDFTPGIYRFSRGQYPVVYPSSAPLGSAATAFKCYAKPNIGLVPFPTYSQVGSFSQSGPGGVQFMLSIAGMACLAGPFSDHLVIHYRGMSGVAGSGTPTAYTWIERKVLSQSDPPNPTNVHTVYTNSYTAAGTQITNWANMDIGEFQNAGVYSRAVITSDFVYSAPNFIPTWVSVPDWASTAESNSGNLLPPAFETPRVFYHATRFGAFQCPFNTTATNGYSGNNGDLLTVSTTPLVLQPFSQAGVFFAEMGAVVGTWGSVSTGEFFALYTQGGAVVIYGDLATPTQVIKLPGVVGTGNVIGKAALSSVGLVYATEDDGVYAWNGGNTAQKISSQVPDDVFYRTTIPGSFGLTDHFHSSQAAWGQWIMFPNNWVYDQTTNSWWNSEDPNVLNFQVNAPSVQGLFFHSAPGFVSNNNGASLTLNTYRWNKSTPASSWTWVSNPLPVTVGALVSIQAIEIVASNPASSSSTIVVTPTVPAGQTPYPQQNATQSQTFTIPATTVASRQALKFGYKDSNIQLQIVATNSSSGPAPTLHSITVGYTVTSTSGVA